jgi:protein-disulfide isomerase-like protein with CxxC motif
VSTVTFWFDPSCPFTWRTSRWMRAVAPRKGATVDWRLMSLGILNEGKDLPEQWRAMMDWSRTAQRLLVAVGQEHGPEGIDRLYTAIGTRRHDNGEDATEELLVAALADAGLPAGLIERSRDESLDPVIQDSHKLGQERVGTESGSPIHAIGDGPGFFGPVVVPVPGDEAGDRLFDAVALLATVPEFSELKRARASF